MREACLDRVRYDGGSEEACYSAARSASQRHDGRVQQYGLAAGAVAVLLFWALVYLLYLRPRRRRAEQADAA